MRATWTLKRPLKVVGNIFDLVPFALFDNNVAEAHCKERTKLTSSGSNFVSTLINTDI
jgi:hypothetical protein